MDRPDGEHLPELAQFVESFPNRRWNRIGREGTMDHSPISGTQTR